MESLTGFAERSKAVFLGIHLNSSRQRAAYDGYHLPHEQVEPPVGLKSFPVLFSTPIDLGKAVGHLSVLAMLKGRGDVRLGELQRHDEGDAVAAPGRLEKVG